MSIPSIRKVLASAPAPLSALEISQLDEESVDAIEVAKAMYWMTKQGEVQRHRLDNHRWGYVLAPGNAERLPRRKARADAVTQAIPEETPAPTGEAEPPRSDGADAPSGTLGTGSTPRPAGRSLPRTRSGDAPTLPSTDGASAQSETLRLAPDPDPGPAPGSDPGTRANPHPAGMGAACPTPRAGGGSGGAPASADPLLAWIRDGYPRMADARLHAARLRALGDWPAMHPDVACWLYELAAQIERP